MRTSFVLAATLLALPTSAFAQWTLPQGEVLVGTSFDFQFADSEFFGLEGEPSGERQFPLNGQFFGASFNLSARAGVTDNFEVELLLPFRVVSYTSDPTILLDQPADSTIGSLDFFQQNIIDFGQTNVGVADVQFATRYRWLNAPLVLTTELRAKIPGGYDSPEGTFGDRPATTEEFLSDLERFVRPGNVTDDITLGDGQFDLALRQLFGTGFDTGTFIAGDVGYNLRLGGAADQLVGSLRAGQLIGKIVLVFAGANAALSVQEGDRIGVSVAAIDPSVRAQDFGGLSNLLLREVRLRRDFVDVYGGIIFRLTDRSELKFSYSRTLWGRNVAAVSTFSLGIGVRSDVFGPQ